MPCIRERFQSDMIHEEGDFKGDAMTDGKPVYLLHQWHDVISGTKTIQNYLTSAVYLVIIPAFHKSSRKNNTRQDKPAVYVTCCLPQEFPVP